MKIRVDRIRPEGLVLEEQATPESLELSQGQIRLKGPLVVRAHLSRVSDQIFAELELSGTLLMTCGRCLEEQEIPLLKQARHDYLFDKMQPVIDLTPDIRDDLILDFPMQPLCSPDCKGLCPRCGINRNLKNCSCAQ